MLQFPRKKGNCACCRNCREAPTDFHIISPFPRPKRQYSLCIHKAAAAAASRRSDPHLWRAHYSGLYGADLLIFSQPWRRTPRPVCRNRRRRLALPSATGLLVLAAARSEDVFAVNASESVGGGQKVGAEREKQAPYIFMSTSRTETGSLSHWLEEFGGARWMRKPHPLPPPLPPLQFCPHCSGGALACCQPLLCVHKLTVFMLRHSQHALFCRASTWTSSLTSKEILWAESSATVSQSKVGMP